MTRFEPQADLHTHTNCSDGTLSPEDLVQEAERADLAAVAITDHDSVAGVKAAQACAQNLGVELIPGVELSSTDGDRDIHIVGLFIDVENSTLTEFLRLLQHERELRISKIVGKLHGLGVHVDEQEILDTAGHSAPGRPHVAEVLCNMGVVSTFNEAFRRYIGDTAPAYVGKELLTPEGAVALVREAGGVPIFAHPGLTNRDQRLVELAHNGLEGVEVFCAYHYPATIDRYQRLARKHDLLISGGSDFHGARNENVCLGAATVPMRLVDKLRTAAALIRQTQPGLPTSAPAKRLEETVGHPLHHSAGNLPTMDS